MRLWFRLSLISVAFGVAAAAHALGDVKPGRINVTVEGMAAGQPIPETQALCTPSADGTSTKVVAALRPTIRWSGAPKDTASIAVFMMDPDVPADFTDAGKTGKTLAENMPRQDFFHYGLVNIPPQATRVIDNTGNINKNIGYPLYIDPSDPAHGTMELVNDLGLNGYVNPPTAYGGPCPPWNDERMHHYHFIVLALDKEADAVLNAPRASDCNSQACQPDTAKNTFDRLMQSKSVLAKGTVIGTYSLNSELRSKAATAK